MNRQPAFFIFKLRQNIALEGDLLLAKMELEALLHTSVEGIANIDDAILVAPMLAALEGFGRLNNHVRRGATQAFAGHSAIDRLAGLIRRVSFVQRIYCVTDDSVDARQALTQMERELGSILTFGADQGKLVIQAVPHYTLFELSDVVARHSSGVKETKRNLTALLDALLSRTDERHAKRLAEDACSAQSTTSHLSHDIHYYKAKFFPRLARSLLNIGAERVEGTEHRVIDNFVGSGTTLLEASTLGIPSVGLDIDPLSVLIARAKLDVVKLSSHDLSAAVTSVQATLARKNGQRGLFDIWSDDPGGVPTITFPAWLMKNRRMTQAIADELSEEICTVRSAIAMSEPQFHSLFRVLMSDAISRRLRMRFLGTGVGRFSLTFAKTSIPRLFNKSLQQYANVVATAEWLRETIHLEFADAQVVEADTRRIPEMVGTFDLLLTSPPYLPASSGRESYAKARAPSLIALGMRESDNVDTLVDTSIGSMDGNSVDLATLTEHERIVVNWLRHDELRAPKAEPTARYFLDMRRTFAEMYRILEPGAMAVVISGKQSTFYQFSTRDALHIVNAAELLADEAAGVGFIVEALHDLKLHKSNMNARPRALDDYYETLIVLRR